MKRTRFFFFFLIACIYGQSQKPQIIRLRKDHPGLYFFQKGNPSDTVSKGQHDLFYISMSDSLKKDLVFSLDNAQLLAVQKDSIYQLKYVPGMRYECAYIKNDSTKKNWEWRNYVNGASSEARNAVRIQVFSRQYPDRLIENKYVYLLKE